MTKVEYLKNKIDEGLKRCKSNNIAIYCGRITKSQKEKLSKWYDVEREPFGFVKFTKKGDL